MQWYSLLVLITSYLTLVENGCTPPAKYYIGCSSTMTIANAIQTCTQYGMTLLNLTNSSTLSSDVALLNTTLISVNCTSNFWFSSGNTTGYVASITTLGNVLANLLGGVGLLLGSVIDLITCLLFCPPTTTAPPITSAVFVCVRPLQQMVIQKCQLTSSQSNMRFFRFQVNPMYGGILSSFATNSQTACSAQCSSNTLCTGISYIGGTCYLYI
jgi:hypothetical protein